MRRCFYHTDVVQNAVFHKTRQTASIQYSGPSKHAWAFNETVLKFPKSPIHAFNKSGRHLEFLIYDVIRGKTSAAIFKF